MNRLRTVVFGGLVAGSLIMSAGSALAQADWRDVRHDQERLRMDNDELARRRNQLDFDLDHRASSYQIDGDYRAIENSLDTIHRDRETLRRDLRDLQ